MYFRRNVGAVIWESWIMRARVAGLFVPVPASHLICLRSMYLFYFSRGFIVRHPRTRDVCYWTGRVYPSVPLRLRQWERPYFFHRQILAAVKIHIGASFSRRRLFIARTRSENIRKPRSFYRGRSRERQPPRDPRPLPTFLRKLDMQSVPDFSPFVARGKTLIKLKRGGPLCYCITQIHGPPLLLAVNSLSHRVILVNDVVAKILQIYNPNISCIL